MLFYMGVAPGAFLAQLEETDNTSKTIERLDSIPVVLGVNGYKENFVYGVDVGVNLFPKRDGQYIDGREHGYAAVCLGWSVTERIKILGKIGVSAAGLKNHGIRDEKNDSYDLVRYETDKTYKNSIKDDDKKSIDSFILWTPFVGPRLEFRFNKEWSGFAEGHIGLWSRPDGDVVYYVKQKHLDPDGNVNVDVGYVMVKKTKEIIVSSIQNVSYRIGFGVVYSVQIDN